MSEQAIADAEDKREDIDWGGIRASASALGIRGAARQAASNLTPEEQKRFVFRVLRRAAREGWSDFIPKRLTPRSNCAMPLSSSVLTGAEIIAQHMEECDGASKTGYATVSKKLATRFSEMDPDELIACTPAVKDGVTIADKTFGWTKQASEKHAALVQIAISGCPTVTVQGQPADG